MRILVTGGAGFIGSNLVAKLGDDHDVVILDDLSTGFLENVEGLPGELIIGTILDEDLLHEAIAGCESVVHLAAIPSVPRSVDEPMPTHFANVNGTLNVLRAAHRVGAHVSVASSSSVYGATAVLPKIESMPARPRSPYAVSKLAAESYTIAWQHSYGLPTIAFRFFNVFGPRQRAGHAYAAVIPAFIAAALSGRPLPIDGDGLQTRDFTYVDSVTSILSAAATKRVSSPIPVNLAFGSRNSLLDLADRLSQALGRDLPREHRVPRAGDVRDSQAANDALRNLFPDATATDLDEALRLTLAWWQASGMDRQIS